MTVSDRGWWQLGCLCPSTTAYPNATRNECRESLKDCFAGSTVAFPQRERCQPWRFRPATQPRLASCPRHHTLRHTFVGTTAACALCEVRGVKSHGTPCHRTLCRCNHADTCLVPVMVVLSSGAPPPWKVAQIVLLNYFSKVDCG